MEGEGAVTRLRPATREQPTSYARPDPRQLAVIGADFVQWTGKSFAHHVVADREGLWLLKAESRSRNRMGYLLGLRFANVAEVRPLTTVDRDDLTALGFEGVDADWYRVRAAQSHSRRDLPRQSIDEATAAELVLSLWIRRRDAHAYNRAYVDGIPVFFDFSVAFPRSAARQPVEAFFSEEGDGFAGAWSVREIPRATLVTTGYARSHGGWGGTHFVTSVRAFAQVARECAARIAADAERVDLLITLAGFEGDEAAEVCAELAAGREVIREEVELMLEMVQRR